ncbi:hypothetical protein CC2G_014376 [Coprinopsis cinerea AmutBmut pab1-1]|nr:hypothetical protein CC2G_014376 [Coprinopsis cinerea AmutBmut pab1-1]
MIIVEPSGSKANPPDYGTAVNRPRHPPASTPTPAIYRFTPWTGTSMLILPPQDETNQQPLYRITVELDLNPFLPVSTVTRIERVGGRPSPGSEGAGVVAEFSMSMNRKRGTLTMPSTGISTRLSKVIRSVGSGSGKVFEWTFRDVVLKWDCTEVLQDGSGMLVCYRVLANSASTGPGGIPLRQEIQIATFVTPPLDGSPPLPDATLTVFPQGHAVMDQLVLSGLVAVRILAR